MHITRNIRVYLNMQVRSAESGQPSWEPAARLLRGNQAVPEFPKGMWAVGLETPGGIAGRGTTALQAMNLPRLAPLMMLHSSFRSIMINNSTLRPICFSESP